MSGEIPTGVLRRTPHPVIVTIRDNKDILGYYSIPIIPLLQGGVLLKDCLRS